MQTLIQCKGCNQNKPHHAHEYCTNCYHKFIVRKTGDFSRQDTQAYKEHLSAIKDKISTTQKQRHQQQNKISSQLSPEQLKELYCEQKMSMGDIAKRFGCSRVYIMQLLKKYDLPVRTKSMARAEAKIKGKNVGFNAINQDFFKVQSPEMAYVLGFIYSDGNINNLLDSFSISQKEPEILYKIKELMSSDHKIVRKSKQELYTLTIGNKVMINDLLSLGLTPNKSLDVKFPVLRDDLYGHFIRGYFDGDGSICLLSKKTWRVSFVSGSEEFIKGICEALSKYIGTGLRTIHQSSAGSKALTLYYFKKIELIKIFQYFYDDITIEKELYLKRKYKLFLECYEKCVKKSV